MRGVFNSVSVLLGDILWAFGENLWLILIVLLILCALTH